MPASAVFAEPSASASNGAAELAATPAATPPTLPEWFPADVFLPDDRVVVEVNENLGAHVVELRTAGDVFPMAARAQTAMLAAGWSEKHYSPNDARGGASMYYRKGDRSATLAMISAGTNQVRMIYNFANLGG